MHIENKHTRYIVGMRDLDGFWARGEHDNEPQAIKHLKNLFNTAPNIQWEIVEQTVTNKVIHTTTISNKL